MGLFHLGCYCIGRHSCWIRALYGRGECPEDCWDKRRLRWCLLTCPQRILQMRALDQLTPAAHGWFGLPFLWTALLCYCPLLLRLPWQVKQFTNVDRKSDKVRYIGVNNDTRTINHNAREYNAARHHFYVQVVSGDPLRRIHYRSHVPLYLLAQLCQRQFFVVLNLLLYVSKRIACRKLLKKTWVDDM